jgi:WD40 repeat protein
MKQLFFPAMITVLLLSQRASAQCCDMTPDCRRVVTLADEKGLKVWDTVEGKVVATLPLRPSRNFGETPGVVEMAISPDGKRIFVVEVDEKAMKKGGQPLVSVLDADSGKRLFSARRHCSTLAVSPDGKRIAYIDSEGCGEDPAAQPALTLVSADLKNGWHTLKIDPINDGTVSTICFSPDGKHIACGLLGAGGIKLWAPEEKAHRLIETAAVFGQGSLCWSADGKQLAAGDLYGNVRLYNAAKGEKPSVRFTAYGNGKRGQEPGPVARTVSFGPGSKRLITGGDQGEVKIWDLEAKPPALLHTLKGHENDIMCAKMSADGKTVVSSDPSGQIKIWNANDGKLLRNLPEARQR